MNSSEISGDLLVEVGRTASKYVMFAQKMLMGDSILFTLALRNKGVKDR